MTDQPNDTAKARAEAAFDLPASATAPDAMATPFGESPEPWRAAGLGRRVSSLERSRGPATLQGQRYLANGPVASQFASRAAFTLVEFWYLECFLPLCKLTFELSWQSRHRSAASGSRSSLPSSLFALCGSWQDVHNTFPSSK